MLKLISILFILIPIALCGQRYKTVELKPITKQGWQYYYDLKKVSTPLALEVPLMSLDDEEITKNLQWSKSFRSASGLIALAPLIYLISISNNSTYSDPTVFWIVFGGTFATQLGLTAISHIKLGKAIDRYNTLIFQPSGNSLGLQITWKF